MNPAQSLYEFTMNLLNDPSARGAFGENPQHTLSEAGLGDISTADLHDILPLVLDFAPMHNGLSLDSLGDGPSSAAEQLKALTQTLTVGDTSSENNLFGAVSGMTALTNGLSSAQDLSHSLDTGLAGGDTNLVGTVTNAVDAGHVAGQLTGGDLTSHLTGGDLTGALSTGDATGAVTGAVDHVANLTSGIGGVSGVGSTVTDLTGSLHNATGVEHLAGNVTSHLGDVASHLGGVTGHLGDIAHNGTIDNVTSHLSDIGNHSGDVSGELHDVVGGIGNGALGHLDAVHDVALLSGNDVDLHH
ncbi:IniB N-terminal domain-containing protein [Amycolatopsis sp. PS_44_ISF1]|uniref:IniB N-terminal domain-containing protein n=1 Tax=Amycolatopsis sp. PS_44_ISF1 TaxID=2974917 RepID=UPI0028DD5C99|nr:IniB N-terminal domain-containing protein [Amycolatopsis sp. PS_44_ISF1]MDT8915273.1 IniB N-terminal domain-containing protein [Amycolatopsis sp. PS_44_ISF1]